MKIKSLTLQAIRVTSLEIGFATLLAATIPLCALERINLDTSGGEMVGGIAIGSTVSADGRYVVFESNADLVPEKMSSSYDVYLRDRVLNTTTRISVNVAGDEANGSSGGSAISANGKFVAFHSAATNLVAGDTNDQEDVFVKDLTTGVVDRVSVATGGAQTMIWPSSAPSISGDGRYVAFYSPADDLVGGDTNGNTDIFLRDRQNATTTRVNVGPLGVEANAGESYSPAISDDGSAVAFRSFATNLVSPATSGNASIFVRDLGTNTTTLVSRSTGGAEADFDCDFPKLSADGRYVIFMSGASNLDPADTDFAPDIFLHDRQLGTTTVVSVATGGTKGNNASFNAAISADGSYIGFMSESTNLVSGDTNAKNDVFVRNLSSGVTERVSVGPNGVQGDDHSGSSIDFTADGSAFVFESSAGTLVAGDTNMTHDIFYGTSMPPVTPPPVMTPPDTTVQQAVIQKQVKTAKKKLKAAKRGGKKSKAKRYKKKIKKLKAQLRQL